MSTTLDSTTLRWQQMVANYQRPDSRRAVMQIVNSIGLYVAFWAAMYWSLSISYWLTLLLSIPTAGFLMRVFIILHDCGHGSFFKSQKLNDAVGNLCGVLTFTSYYDWRREHALHHATSGDLDRRGMGDVTTLTVQEYLALPPKKQWGYRVYRNPLFMFGVGGLYLFIIKNRFPYAESIREKNNVRFTNMALLLIVIIASLTIGPWNYLLIQLPVLFLAAAMGNWLFYIQHQFEDTYWEHHPEWNYIRAAMEGTSYYKLPLVLQWFSGNIGFHHIHHLAPRIPNYNLPRCYDENPSFQHITTITFREGFRMANLKLWDETRSRLVGWEHVETYQVSNLFR